MQTEHLILVDTFCAWHEVEYSFIDTMYEYGLIEITRKDDKAFIPESELKNAERLARLYNDLHVNPEGVEVISYLLVRLNQQQDEIKQLQNKLRFYES